MLMMLCLFRIDVALECAVASGFPAPTVAGTPALCFRRNYFALTASVSLSRSASMIYIPGPNGGPAIAVRSLSLRISARISDRDEAVPLVCFSPKREQDKKMTPTPREVPLRYIMDGVSQHTVSFERNQFLRSTNNPVGAGLSTSYSGLYVMQLSDLVHKGSML